mgnify:CR=1 FL=1
MRTDPLRPARPVSLADRLTRALLLALAAVWLCLLYTSPSPRD